MEISSLQVRLPGTRQRLLTMIAFRNIQFLPAPPNGLSGKVANTGAGALVLHADSTGSGAGTVLFPTSGSATSLDWSKSTGAVSIYYNPASYKSPTDFAGNSHVLLSLPSQLTSYILVNTVANLQDIATNVNANYALGRDIDARSAQRFATITPTFSGIFDGLGILLAISPLAPRHLVCLTAVYSARLARTVSCVI